MKRFNVTALLAVLALGSCSNSLVEKSEEAASVPAGFGTVQVSLGLGAARTAIPAPTNLTYIYFFSKDGGAPVVQTPAGGVFTLEAGTYTLTVQASVVEGETSNLSAQGTSASFTVTAGEDAGTVEVTLSPTVSEGTGTLKYTFNFPPGATVDTLTLTPFGGTGDPIDLKGSGAISSGETYTEASVGAGYWLLQAALMKPDDEGNTAEAGMVEVVHIYKNLETVAGPYTFTIGEFSFITSVADLTAYLATLPVGTADTPSTVSLALTFNTGTVQSGQIGWGAINTAVKNSGKYVILDLSASTAANTRTANTIAGDSTPSGHHFNLIQNNTYIKGIILPNTLTSIGYAAFRYDSHLTSVTIPDSVTSIGNHAFLGCTGLTSVTIPGSVTSIGDVAFAYCSGLTSMIIPDTVTSIGNKVFMYCIGLTSVTIPGNVTSIGESTFQGCSKLTSVTIPEGVTSIGNKAFYDCSGLISVTIPEGVNRIGESAFEDCS
jgi:hypothetical protein